MSHKQATHHIRETCCFIFLLPLRRRVKRAKLHAAERPYFVIQKTIYNPFRLVKPSKNPAFHSQHFFRAVFLAFWRLNWTDATDRGNMKKMPTRWNASRAHQSNCAPPLVRIATPFCYEHHNYPFRRVTPLSHAHHDASRAENQAEQIMTPFIDFWCGEKSDEILPKKPCNWMKMKLRDLPRISLVALKRAVWYLLVISSGAGARDHGA